MLLLCCSSPGAGMVGSLMLRLFIRLDLRRSMLWMGELLLGVRCRPRLIVAAACSEDRGGDLGEGGLLRKESALWREMRRGGCGVMVGVVGVAEAVVGESGRELTSGMAV